MKVKKKILLVQETDWILRGPHYHHHIFGRLNQEKYDIRVADFPLIWDKEKRDEYPLFKNFHMLEVGCKVDSSRSIKIFRPLFINLPLFNILSIYFQRKVIKKQIKDFRPNVVICFASLLNVNYVIRKCKKNNISFIYCHFEKYYTLVPIKFLKRFSKRLEDKAIKNSNKNLVLNHAFKEYVDRICGSGENNVLISQGVDLSRFNPDIKANDKKEKYGINEEDTVLFFMGWIYKFSGIKEVAQSVAKLTDKNLKLMIVGEGGLYDELQKFIKTNDLENKIIMTGWVPYEEIPSYISMADICLLPAYNNEVMRNIVPIKIYEYLAMGKPVIATKLPGIMKEFGNDNGVVYIENPEHVLKRAINLMENSRNEGWKGRKFAEKYDWRKITNKFEKFLDKLF